MRRSQFMIAMIVGLLSMSPISGAQPADSNGILLVANKAASTVGIVDPKSGEQVATIAEGGITGHELIASPDGRTAYVPI